jgi:hypothetical protein
MLESIICSIEDIIQSLVDKDKESIRYKFVVILRRVKPPRSNISKD